MRSDSSFSVLLSGCHPVDQNGGQAMRNVNEDAHKRPYTVPQLTVHGTLEELTQYCDKRLGFKDGFTFEGAQVVCRSVS
jgi:hypothetical protein